MYQNHCYDFGVYCDYTESELQTDFLVYRLMMRTVVMFDKRK